MHECCVGVLKGRVLLFKSFADDDDDFENHILPNALMTDVIIINKRI